MAMQIRFLWTLVAITMVAPVLFAQEETHPPSKYWTATAGSTATFQSSYRYGQPHSYGDSTRRTMTKAASLPATSMENHNPSSRRRISTPRTNLSGFKFVDPAKFLAQPSANPAPSGLNVIPRMRVQQNLSDATPVQVAQQQGSTTRRQAARSNFSDQTDDQELSVADVNAPIGLVPFVDIAQDDPMNLLNKPADDEVVLQPNSYSELTGQYFQSHYASWSAHHFSHRPLLFEEVNLERYGNELPLQELVSTGHFFASAALLPYKLGQAYDSGCITTLGHFRPGQCVPYRHHWGQKSTRGGLFQGLVVTALAL